MPRRTLWFAPDLKISNEPLILSLLKYRLLVDRVPATLPSSANLVSSRTDDGRQMPIIDLDFPHVFVNSTSSGHSHLYLDVPMSQWRWVALMIGLRLARVVEPGYFIWSLRRGANFVRLPGIEKAPEETPKPDYGWFFRIK